MTIKRKKGEKRVKEEEKKAHKWVNCSLDWLVRYITFDKKKDKQNLLSVCIFLLFILTNAFLIMLLGILLKSILQYTFGLNYTTYLFLISILPIAICAILVVYTSFKKYKFITSYLIIALFVISIFLIAKWWASLIIYLVLIVLSPFCIRNWKKPNIILLIIISLILFTLTIGLFSINDLYGASSYNPFSFNYCDTSTQSPYTMTYASINGIILADYNLKATFKPNIHNISGSISYTLTNGSSFSKEFKGDFTPPRDISYISLWLNANSETNESLCLTNGYRIPKPFLLEDKAQENKEKFIAYFIALLNLSFLVVPYVVLKLYKDLFKKG